MIPASGFMKSSPCSSPRLRHSSSDSCLSRLLLGRIDRWGRTSHSALSASLIGAIVAVLLHSLIDFAIFEPGVWMTFWVLLACLVALWRRESSSHAASHRLPKLKWLAGGLALVLLGTYVHWIWMPVYRVTAGIQKSQQAASFGRFDLAHAALEEAMRADRLSPAAANLNGRLYMQQYEQPSQRSAALLEQAARCFRAAIAGSPADYKSYEKLAIVCTELGRYQEAYEWYLKTADLYPGSERLWFQLGQLAERLGQDDAAFGHYTRAVEIEDSYRQQFRRMYPERKEIVSRLGEKEYRLARERIDQLRTRAPQGPAQPKQ